MAFRAYIFRIFVFAILTILLSGLSAQNEQDAIRFGQRGIGGTSRFVALSGAMGAIGGDPSSVTVNPGGLGLYRKGQAVMSIAVNNVTSNALHYANESNATKASGRLGHLSIVLSGPIDYSSWKFGNMIFGYQNKDNYNITYKAEGVNNESSYLDQYFVDIIDEPNLYLEDIEAYFPFGAGLAWGSQLIDTVGGHYFHANPFYGQTQGKETQFNRGLGEYYTGFGANYEDKLYLGITLGFSSLNFKSSSTYYEKLDQPSLVGLTEWKQYDELSTTGSGFNVKLGFIYWIRETLRVGLAFNGREKFKLTDKYYSKIDAEWDFREATFAESPDGYNEYLYNSPYKFIGSLGLVRSALGMINIDIEYIDYSAMNYQAQSGFGTDFSTVNEKLRNTYHATTNLRLGGEMLFGPYYFRGGGSYWANPYKSGNKLDRYRLSAGLGWRKSYYFIDFAFGYEWQTGFKTPIHYSENVHLIPTEINSRQSQFVLTLGMKFKEEL